MSPQTLTFNPPIKAREIVGEKHAQHGTGAFVPHPWGECDNCVDKPEPTPIRDLGATVALIGLLVDPASGAGQAIVVGPSGLIEYRDPQTIELFIEF